MHRIALTPIAAVGLMTVLSLTACSSDNGSTQAQTSSGSATSASSASPAASPGITCPDIDSDLNTVVNDLKKEDAAYQEAWVTGGDSSDLEALITDTQASHSGINQLNTDAATFGADASEYLGNESPALSPGWQTEYGTVTSDINALAKDCDQPAAPANTSANS